MWSFVERNLMDQQDMDNKRAMELMKWNDYT